MHNDFLNRARSSAVEADSRPPSATLVLRSILRCAIGAMLLEYGVSKLFAFPASLSRGEALPPLIYASAIIELVAGSLLTVGLLTRLAAFIVSGEMAVVYFVHFLPRSAWPSISGGDLAITWCFALLYLSAVGGGSVSVDKLLHLWRSRGNASTGQFS